MTQRQDLNTMWNSKWKAGQTRWQMSDVHAYLKEYFHMFTEGNISGKRILVPLCGATPDMAWFYEQGLTVVGIELSDLAIKKFFEDNNLSFTVKESSSPLTCNMYIHDERLKLFQGDLFDLDVESLGGCFDYWWDRGSLGAMMAGEQQYYVEKISSFMSPNARCLMELVEYDPSIKSGPPESISHGQLTNLFGNQFQIEELKRVTEDELPEHHSKIGLNSLRVNYLLTRK